MKITQIVNALNRALKNKFPHLKGTLIAKESIEPLSIKVYKKHKVELYYHIPRHNRLVFTFQLSQRITEEAKDSMEEEFYLSFLEEIFFHLNEIEDEITKV